MKKLLTSVLVTVMLFTTLTTRVLAENKIIYKNTDYLLYEVTKDLKINKTDYGLELSFPSFKLSELNLTKSQIDYIHDYALKVYISSLVVPFGRKTHKIENGASIRKMVSGFSANQPPGGNKFQSGGGFYYSDDGGMPISISVQFPYPFNLLSASVSLGSSTGFGKFVEVPDRTNYYKLFVEKIYDCKPYIVWEVDIATGQKTKYASGMTTILFNVNQYAKKV